MSAKLPSYIEIDGRADASVRPPGVFTGARAWVFGAYGDRGRMQELADRLITQPSGGALTATVPTRLVSFIFFNGDKLSSPNAPIGWTPNREFIIAFPLIVRRRGNPLDIRFGLLPAWVYINNYRGMVTGRESWGYFKNLGEVTSPKAWSSSFQCALDTLAFQPASPDTEGRVTRLVEVNLVPGTGASPTAMDGGTDEQLPHFVSLLGEHVEADAAELFRDATAGLTALSVPAFNLKQFRDVADGAKACYQAVTTSPLQVLGLTGLQKLRGDYTITIKDVASAQIAQLLGLGASPIPVKFGIGAEPAYQAIAGEVLWQA
jgi:hypothetical protein